MGLVWLSQVAPYLERIAATVEAGGIEPPSLTDYRTELLSSLDLIAVNDQQPIAQTSGFFGLLCIFYFLLTGSRRPAPT